MALGRFAFFAAVFCVALNITFADMNDEIKKYAAKGAEIFKKCSSETNLSEDLGRKVFNTVLNYDPLPEGDGVKCYVACHLEATGDMNHDGSMIWDHITEVKDKIYSEEDKKKVHQAVDTCRKTEIKTGDPCERAYNSAQCYYGNLKKLNTTPIKANI